VKITTVDGLRRRYAAPGTRALAKQLDHLDRHCRHFITLSPFVLLATGGADGRADISPRGEAPGWIHVIDPRHLAIPDRPGNNRLDTLTNLLDDPAIGLLFMIPGVNETLRVNGRAEIRDDDDLRERFTVRGRPPATVIVVAVEEAYLHCAKALMRARLWDPEAQIDRHTFPSLNEMIRDQMGGTGPVESEEAMVARYREILY